LTTAAETKLRAIPWGRPTGSALEVRTHYEDARVRILNGDVLAALRSLPERSVDMVLTSPPYFGLRDYGYGGNNDMVKALEEVSASLPG